MRVETGRRRWLAAAGALTLGGAAGMPLAHAQGWPSKPIKILVGFAPGGTTDPYARTFGDFLSQKFNVPVVVENRPGAGGFIALEALSRSPGDGYTIGITTTGSVWGSRVLYNKVPFNADKDFVPVAMFPVGPLLFAVPSTLPVNSVSEWIEYARKYSLAMGSYAPASVPHLITAELNRNKGTHVSIVQYKGEGPMWPDVATGVIHGAVGSYVALSPHLARGTVKVLATVGKERSPKLPNVRSFIDQGFDAPIFTLDGGLVMLAPSSTPNDIVQRLSDAFMEGADSPKAVALREAFAIEAKPSPTAEAKRRWKADSPIWIAMTAQMGLKLD